MSNPEPQIEVSQSTAEGEQKEFPIMSIRNRRLWSGLTKEEDIKWKEFINYLQSIENEKKTHRKKITSDKLIYDYVSELIKEWETNIRPKLPPETLEKIKVE